MSSDANAKALIDAIQQIVKADSDRIIAAINDLSAKVEKQHQENTNNVSTGLTNTQVTIESLKTQIGDIAKTSQKQVRVPKTPATVAAATAAVTAAKTTAAAAITQAVANVEGAVTQVAAAVATETTKVSTNILTWFKEQYESVAEFRQKVNDAFQKILPEKHKEMHEDKNIADKKTEEAKNKARAAYIWTAIKNAADNKEKVNEEARAFNKEMRTQHDALKNKDSSKGTPTPQTAEPTTPKADAAAAK